MFMNPVPPHDGSPLFPMIGRWLYRCEVSTQVKCASLLPSRTICKNSGAVYGYRMFASYLLHIPTLDYALLPTAPRIDICPVGILGPEVSQHSPPPPAQPVHQTCEPTDEYGFQGLRSNGSGKISIVTLYQPEEQEAAASTSLSRTLSSTHWQSGRKIRRSCVQSSRLQDQPSSGF